MTSTGKHYCVCTCHEFATFSDCGCCYDPDAERQAEEDLAALREHYAKTRSLREARDLAGIGDDSDLPPGYRSYVDHLDGNPYNNDPDNLRVVKGNERGA